MREYNFMIKEGFTKGLREDKKNRRNSQELVTCRNLRPTKYGLSAHDPITVASLTAARNIVSDGSFDNPAKWGEANGWNIADGKATHTPHIDMPLWQDTGIYNTVDRVYQFTFTVKTCTVGSVTPAIQSSTGTARTANGTYTESITHQGSIDPDLIIFFFPSLDFDGSVDDVIMEVSTWPFPQLFKGKTVTLLADMNRIYTVNEDTWELTEIALYDALDTDSAKTISAVGPWQFADFRDVWFLFNASCTIVKVPSFSGKTVVFDHVRINCGLNFRNKMVLGGFASPVGVESVFDGTRWADIWKTWLEYGGGGAFTYEDMEIGTNWVMWSAAGGGDIYWPFVAELSMFGIPNVAQQDILHPHYTDFIRTNDIGFLPMPWQGQIRCIKQLGNNVIVYGDGGVSALVPHEDGRGFEIVEINRVGILSKEIVAGDERNHLFIDKTGIIWYLAADLSLTKKEYEYLFDGLLNEYIVISHDPQENVFYLCSENKGYVLSGSGVGELVNQPVSLIFAKPPGEDIETLIGSYTEYTADTAFEIVLDTFDMELRAIKTVHGLSVGATDITDLQAAIEFRYDGSQAFSTSSWISATQEGISTPIISAVDFRVKLKGTISSADAKIDWLELRWKLSDKRAIRGQHSFAS